jgi:hypothetical protein
MLSQYIRENAFLEPSGAASDFTNFFCFLLGTTTVECKSGYGLETATEIKMLKVLEKAKTIHPIEISSTFLGAHSVPK